MSSLLPSSSLFNICNNLLTFLSKLPFVKYHTHRESLNVSLISIIKQQLCERPLHSTPNQEIEKSPSLETSLCPSQSWHPLFPLKIFATMNFLVLKSLPFFTVFPSKHESQNTTVQFCLYINRIIQYVLFCVWLLLFKLFLRNLSMLLWMSDFVHFLDVCYSTVGKG